MKTSAKGLYALEQREGTRFTAYKDTKGIWTIGVGHTGPEVKEGLKWTSAQVDFALAKDVLWAEEAVNDVNSILNQNQFDALVSFVFNIGATAFGKSTMKRMLDAGKFDDAGKQFDKWHIPVEIIGRRDSEKKQFLS